MVIEKMRRTMGQRDNIRNMAVIAHVDHGKTTLTDALLARAGIISMDQAGDKKATHTRKDEQAKGITIKSTTVSMHYELNVPTGPVTEEVPAGRSLVVNLIDSPGHVDFSSEVTAALRIADGAMVVVDCIEGICVQTETVLRQALTERIKPVLMINKMDRAVFEVQLTAEEIYQSLSRIIENANVILATYGGEDGVMGDIMLDPAKGNVAFGSGLHGWGFNLDQFAKMYADKFKVKKEKMMRRLWGSHFYNPQDKKWTDSPSKGSERGFNKFVLEPVIKMLRECKDNQKEGVLAITEKLGLHLTKEDAELQGKSLMRCVMKKWLPASEAMLHMIVNHLPSPDVAQRYRTEMLYEGPLDDPAATAMKQCDPNGPLMVYVSKMVPSSDKGRFYAIARVFSGTVATGMKVRIMGPDYQPGNKLQTDLFIKNVQRTLVMVGGNVMSVDDVPAGNICGLVGIDKYLVKTGTISTYEQAHNLKVMKFSVSPVVRVAVDVVNPAHLPKLVEGMKRLCKADPMVQCLVDNGQHILLGAGELHLEVCLQDLEEEHAGVAIKRSKPLVSYQETVSEQSDRICLAKSSNKLCRLYMTAEPLPPGLADDIERGKVKSTDDVKERGRYLVDNYDFDLTHSKKIWCFGPNSSGPNMLIDCSKGVQNLHEIRDTVVAGFQWASSEGVLSESTVRGVRFNFQDAHFRGDPSHRGGGQIIPATRRVMLAAMLTAKPKLFEPVYLVEVMCPKTCLGSAINLLSRKRGEVIDQQQQEGTPMCTVKAYMPVNESFGFNGELRGDTGGQAFPQFIFDHWQLLPGDPLDVSSKAGEIVADIRKRKGLHVEVPALDNFLDKL
ncbi:elongation factor 2-like [Mercenaria mercenaria]|uniref:elongation factor 2-like n=1 Tax=Mercenaria mercenaria TaxID=6596 RepID=UPI00234EC31A|nr:elongation factor 2-like [Mercenaria mercenaria]